MAKKSPKTSTPAPAIAAKASTPEVVSTTPVRNSAVPPKSAAVAVSKKPAPTTDAIRLRAYFIWQSNGGGEFENWIRAERELSSI